LYVKNSRKNVDFLSISEVLQFKYIKKSEKFSKKDYNVYKISKKNFEIYIEIYIEILKNYIKLHWRIPQKMFIKFAYDCEWLQTLIRTS